MSPGLFLSAKGPAERRASAYMKDLVPWPGSQLLALEARHRPAMVRGTVPRALVSHPRTDWMGAGLPWVMGPWPQITIGLGPTGVRLRIDLVTS